MRALMVVAHEWKVRPSDLAEWTEAEVINALAFLAWRNSSGESS